jgi:hypothetical protein
MASNKEVYFFPSFGQWVAFGVFNAAGLALETIVLQWVSKQTVRAPGSWVCLPCDD